MPPRSLRSLILLLALTLATPALAQGPLAPPDGSGPSPQDYTGWSVAYLINGVRIDPSDNQQTEIICTNVGTVGATWAVQIFDGGEDPTRVPACETSAASLPVADVDSISTDSVDSNVSFNGTCPSGDGQLASLLGRIIVDSKKAVVLCSARVIFAVSRNAVADLPVTPVGKAPKIKIK